MYNYGIENIVFVTRLNLLVPVDVLQHFSEVKWAAQYDEVRNFISTPFANHGMSNEKIAKWKNSWLKLRLSRGNQFTIKNIEILINKNGFHENQNCKLDYFI